MCDNYGQFFTNDLSEVAPLTSGELTRYIMQQEKEQFDKIAVRYGGTDSIYIANIDAHREVFKELKVYVAIQVPVKNADFKGCQIVEGFLQCSSLADLASVSGMLLTGVTVVIDKSTLEVLETVS